MRRGESSGAFFHGSGEAARDFGELVGAGAQPTVASYRALRRVDSLT